MTPATQKGAGVSRGPACAAITSQARRRLFTHTLLEKTLAVWPEDNLSVERPSIFKTKIK